MKMEFKKSITKEMLVYEETDLVKMAKALASKLRRLKRYSEKEIHAALNMAYYGGYRDRQRDHMLEKTKQLIEKRDKRFLQTVGEKQQ